MLALTLLVAIPAVAADSITLSVTGEGRNASVSGASLEPVGYSHEDQTSSGTISLSVDDRSASDHGWNVTVQAGNFVAGGRSISADNFIITDANAPVHIEGAEIDATGGPIVPQDSAIGSLATPRKVLQANSGYGAGVYQQDLNVQLTVPGQTPAGEYSSNLTVNITAGP
jgi:hypothetical protein